MSKTIVSELKELYGAYGGDVEDVAGAKTTAEVIDAIEDITKARVLVRAEKPTNTIYGYTVSALQSDFEIRDRVIVGDVAKQTSGELVDYWGEGYFIALRVVILDKTIKPEDITMGIKGRVSLDNDLNIALKVEDTDKPLHIIVKANGKEYETLYNLNGLNLVE